jgi:hypothetical protein
LGLVILVNRKSENHFRFSIIDIGDSHKRQTGRLFGISIKAFQNGNLNKKVLSKPYKNIDFPILNVFFDTHKDVGFYNWIKKPLAQGDLKLEKSEQDIELLNTESIKSIVETIDDWYAHKKEEAIIH